MRRIVIESPYSSNREKNLEYLQRCILDALRKGESPFASHQMYTDALNDDDPEQRKLGIEAGYEWWVLADYVVFYTDLGWSPGMEAARERANAHAITTLERKIDDANY